jgi:hypothetical protein
MVVAIRVPDLHVPGDTGRIDDRWQTRGHWHGGRKACYHPRRTTAASDQPGLVIAK